MIIPNIWENKKWQPNHQPAKQHTHVFSHQIIHMDPSENGGIDNAGTRSMANYLEPSIWYGYPYPEETSIKRQLLLEDSVVFLIFHDFQRFSSCNTQHSPALHLSSKFFRTSKASGRDAYRCCPSNRGLIWSALSIDAEPNSIHLGMWRYMPKTHSRPSSWDWFTSRGMCITWVDNLLSFFTSII